MSDWILVKNRFRCLWLLWNFNVFDVRIEWVMLELYINIIKNKKIKNDIYSL